MMQYALQKCVLDAARSLPTRSTLQIYILALRGNVCYEVTRSLRTSAAVISSFTRVLLTARASTFLQPAKRSHGPALPLASPHLFGFQNHTTAASRPGATRPRSGRAPSCGSAGMSIM